MDLKISLGIGGIIGVMVVGIGVVLYIGLFQQNDGSFSVISPLPNEISWTAPREETFESRGMSFVGFEITSNAQAESFNLFNHYDTLFIQNGWVEAISVAAGGATGKQWGYKKDEKYIIFTEKRKFLNTEPGKPSECPCEYTYTIFWTR